MYFITLDGIEDDDLIKKIYTSIDCFNMVNKCFIVYKLKNQICNIKDFKKKMIFHVLKIDLNLYEKCSTDELENLILDVIELNTSVLLDDYVGKDEDFREKVYSIINEYDLKYIKNDKFDFNKEIDLSNLTYNDYQIILEILEEKIDAKTYSDMKFAIKLLVDSKGIIYNEQNNIVADLNKEEFYKLFFYYNEDINSKLQKYLTEYRAPKMLTKNWYEPFIFITNQNDDKLGDKILEYKYKIFNKIKNIHPEQYPNIPIELINKLSENGYIRFDDILKIIVK